MEEKLHLSDKMDENELDNLLKLNANTDELNEYAEILDSIGI